MSFAKVQKVLEKKEISEENLSFPIFIPPIDGIVEGEDSLFDEVWILGGELFGIVATLDVLGTKIMKTIRKVLNIA